MDINSHQYEVGKALDGVEGSVYQLEEITEAVTRKPVKPGLLRALLNPQDKPYSTDTYKWDETIQTVQLPGGKSFSGYGPDAQKDKPKRHRFAIPSMGMRFNVSPQDAKGRRKPGTTDEFLTVAEIVAEQETKINTAWDLLDELAIAQLLTTDTNIVRGGPFEVYNFHTEIVESVRGSKIDMDLDNTALVHEQLFRKQRMLLAQELAKAGDSASAFVCICGDTFFNLRYEIEKNEGLAREIRQVKDLATMPINEITFAGFSYQAFDSFDGITYINYGSEIIAGQPLIGAADAYMIPVGASQLMEVGLAPAETMTYVNTQALSMYSWMTQSEKQGITVYTERNPLYVLKNPRAIRHLTTT